MGALGNGAFLPAALTTPRLKQHLEDEIAWHEQKADEIEMAYETAGEAE